MKRGNVGRKVVGALVVGLIFTASGCVDEVTLCREIPVDTRILEYPLGITWYEDLIVVSNSNVRGEYCSGYLSLFSSDGEGRRNLPVTLEGEEFSIFGEMQIDRERGYLYMTERKMDSLLVFRIDGEPELIRSVPVEGENQDPRGGSDPFGLDVEAAGGSVAVACGGSGEVVIFSPGGEQVIGRVDLGEVRPLRVRFSPGGEDLWAVADRTNSIYRISLDPVELADEFEAIETTTYLKARAVLVHGGDAYIASGYPQAVLVFDPGGGMKNAYPLGEDVDPFDLTWWDSRLYVTSVDRDEIWVQDAEAGALLRVIETSRVVDGIEYGRGPSHITLGPQPGEALVTNYESGDVVVIDLERDKIVKYFPRKEEE